MNKTILNDCLDELDKLEDESVHLVITDPPYGISQLNENWNKEKIDKSIEKSDISTIKSIPVGMKFDPKQSKNLGIFLSKVSEKLLRVCKPGSFCLVFSQPRSVHRVAIAFEDVGFEFREQLIWDYGAGQGKAQGMQNFIKKSKKIPEEDKEGFIKKLDGYKTPQLTPTYESILLFQKPKDGTFVNNYLKHGVGLVNFKNGHRKNKFSHPKPKSNERKEAGKHPTLKPVSLIEDLIEVFSKEEDLILDCFSGSGTTGVACINKNRYFYLIEKEASYYNISTQRIKKYLTNITNAL